MAKACLIAMWDDGISAADWVAKQGAQITDPAALEPLVTQLLDDNPGQVAAFLAGKTKLIGFFVGQVMKQTRGKANPQVVNQVVGRLLEARR